METRETGTSSMPAAAYVMANGHPLSRLEEEGSGHFKMFFDDREGNVAPLMVQYFNGDAVSACAFYKSLCNLRVAINRTKTVQR
jgi:hypothetical protein